MLSIIYCCVKNNVSFFTSSTLKYNQNDKSLKEAKRDAGRDFPNKQNDKNPCAGES